jgi:ABC-type multidrug transport system ATPase subunit
MLTTFLPPTSGDARAPGFSIEPQPVEVRAIGSVPQTATEDGSLAGCENLLFFANTCDIPH